MSSLIIAAHPDDEALSLGGTIIRLVQEKREEVGIVIVTDGSSTQYPGDLKKRKQKNKELIRCCEKLGVKDVVHGEFPDMQLETIRHTEITSFIAKHVQQQNPSTVYTHFPDINKDHERLYESTLVAARSTSGSAVKKIALFPTFSATEWCLPGKGREFIPNEWVDITSTIDQKLEALKCYETELRPPPHPRSLESIRAIAQAIGSKANLGYAEEFMVIRNQW